MVLIYEEDPVNLPVKKTTSTKHNKIPSCTLDENSSSEIINS